MKARKIVFGFMLCIFLLSFFLFLYAVWNIYYEQNQAKQALREWEDLLHQGYGDITEDKIDLDALVALNSEEQVNDHLLLASEQDIALEQHMFTRKVEVGALIGKLSIPTLDQELAIIHGTGEKELAKGVGHYLGSALPGGKGHIVLAGHRQTVFKDLGKVELGDEITVETLAGEFKYEVFKQFIVDQDDRGVIVPHEEEILTLITCYPFQFVGSAPERYILQAKRIVNENKNNTEEGLVVQTIIN